MRLAEVTIPHTLVPAKQPPFSTVKSNNYMPNVLCMMAAKDKGGARRRLDGVGSVSGF